MALGKGGAGAGFSGKIVAWLGAYLISFVGLLHLLLSGEHFEYATYLGLLFLANFAASAVAALGILWTRSRWPWILGVAVAGGALVGFFVSRIFGLPAYPEVQGQWFNFAAWMALAFELPFLGVAALVLTRRGRTLVGAEQERIDREELPPDRQETPEHLDLIEGQMREIRTRITPDLQDLRRHVEPRTLGEQATRTVQTRLRSLLNRVRLPGR